MLKAFTFVPNYESDIKALYGFLVFMVILVILGLMFVGLIRQLSQTTPSVTNDKPVNPPQKTILTNLL